MVSICTIIFIGKKRTSNNDIIIFTMVIQLENDILGVQHEFVNIKLCSLSTSCNNLSYDNTLHFTLHLVG